MRGSNGLLDAKLKRKQSLQWRLGKDFSVEFQTYLILASDIFHRISTVQCVPFTNSTLQHKEF